ncbi:MAG: helix-turn-helix transcriptional regulator [Bacteroidia bacterium]
MGKEDQIPLHNFTKDDEDSIAFKLHSLEKRSYYDFTVPHRHNYFEIFFFEVGGGYHLIDFEEFEIQDGSIHFVSPGQVHVLKRAPGSYGYIVIFSREFFYKATPDNRLLFRHPLLHNRTNYPIIKPVQKHFQELVNCVTRMGQELARNSPYMEELMRLYLHEMLFRSAENLERKQQEPDLVMSFFALLETHFYEWHFVTQYADELAVSDRQLGHELSNSTGKTTLEHIAQRLMLEAMRLLQYSELSVKEIGFRLGFDDPAHFGKFFKKHRKISPGAFRSKSNE